MGSFDADCYVMDVLGPCLIACLLREEMEVYDFVAISLGYWNAVMY